MYNITQKQQTLLKEQLATEQQLIAQAQPNSVHLNQQSHQQKLLNQLRQQENILAIQAHLTALKAQVQRSSSLSLAAPVQRPVQILVPVPIKPNHAPVEPIGASASLSERDGMQKSSNASI